MLAIVRNCSLAAVPRGNGNTFQTGNYIVLHFGTWQGILCKTVVCLSVYLESSVPQVEEEEAATKQTKVVTFDMPKMTVSDYGTTILLSLRESNEMKPTDPSVQFENTAFSFHLIALYLWKILSAPLLFSPDSQLCRGTPTFGLKYANHIF